jgi:DNA-binding winged helix-turn-helix (wHTH) protein
VVTFEFTPFVLDPAKRVLLRAGVPQTLTPRAFDLLLLLVQQRDRVLSKDEILRAVWADTVVEESNLNQQVFVLRKALNGDGHGPEYIATIPRRGYRFVGEVTERSAEFPNSSTRPAAIDEAARAPVSRWLPWMLAAGLMIATPLAFRTWHAAPDASTRILTVTAFPGLERFPSISPDGSFVVFSWTGSNPEDAPDLWIKAVDDDDLRRLTETPFAETSPAWSPDGRDVAFLRAGQGVFVISVLGGSERRIADTGSALGWTPDGRALLVRDRTGDKPHGIFRIDLASNRTGRPELWKMSVNGGTASQLTREGGLQPREAPDGRTLFYLHPPPYASGMSGVSRLMQVPVGGGEEVVVLDRVRFGLWAVTDGGIIFTTIEPERDALDVYGFRDRVVRRLGALPFRFSRIAGLGGLTVSRDGRWALASVTDRWESDIMVVDGVR